MYDLFAVVNHHGDLETGHYTSFVLHNSKWYRCDDHTVTEAETETVLASDACACSLVHVWVSHLAVCSYVLFYGLRGVQFSRVPLSQSQSRSMLSLDPDGGMEMPMLE
jgi:hypothetical protein